SFHPEDTAPEEVATEGSEPRPGLVARPDFAAIAMDFTSVDNIVKAVAFKLQRARPHLSTELVRPRDHQEARLAAIWEEVLHIREIGVQNRFVELGGTSLQAAGIAARIAAEFGVRVPLVQLLSNTSIAELCR